VKLLDVNLLIYVVDEDARDHEAALRWFEEVLSGTETVAFAWFALLGFLRITTRSQGARDPWPIESALDEIQRWLAQPIATVIHPTDRHAAVLRDLLTSRRWRSSTVRRSARATTTSPASPACAGRTRLRREARQRRGVPAAPSGVAIALRAGSVASNE
jgi:predicted nucleic acid-binding protein